MKKAKSEHAPVRTRSGLLRSKAEPGPLHFKGRSPAAAEDRVSTATDSQVEGGRWLKVYVPPRREAGGIGIGRRDSAGPYFARFALELATVASGAVAADEARLTRNELIAPGERERQRALSALLGAIGADQRLVIVHGMHLDNQARPTYVMRLEGEAEHANIDTALDLAVALQADVLMALAVGCPQFGVRAQAEPALARRWPAANRLDFDIAAIGIEKGRAGFADANADEGPLLLPLAPRIQQTFLDSLLASMLSAPCEMEMHIELIGRVVPLPELRSLTAVAQNLGSMDLTHMRLVGGGASMTQPLDEDLVLTQAMLSEWSTAPLGVDVRLMVGSERRLPVTLLRLLGSEITQGRPFALRRASAAPPASQGLDLSAYQPANALVPPLFPSPASLGRLGLPRHYTEVRLRTSSEGVVLGDIPTPFIDEAVSLASSDRSQHCYLIGSTGTGKSTLLRNMLAQDIAAGHGVALIDPHGDLYQQVLECIPPHRSDDLVLADFTHFDQLPGLNLLEFRTQRRELERNFIIQDLTAILRRLYGNVPESMGPMFFLYMRNAVALVMEDPNCQRTMLDVPRVFSDEPFRQYLLQHCKDASVLDFWRGIAGPAQGDASLRSIAPYITNKFTEFTQNELVRVVVGQARSTINFRELMDRRQILLVNLSKGLLSELDTRFLGMLLTGRLFAAAATRASLPPRRRIPFHVYIDEFQNFTSDTLTSMLAESRKYGMAMTLAHQDLGQVPIEMKSSLMSNTGSKMIFRIGAADADSLAQYVAPQYSSHDLMTLPDHHAVARIKVSNVPSPPFVVRTRAPVEAAAGNRDPKATISMVEKARSRYCTSAKEVLANIVTNRDVHLRKANLSRFLSDPDTVAMLHHSGLDTVEDLLNLPVAARGEVFGKIKVLAERVRLMALVAGPR